MEQLRLRVSRSVPRVLILLWRRYEARLSSSRVVSVACVNRMKLAHGTKKEDKYLILLANEYALWCVEVLIQSLRGKAKHSFEVLLFTSLLGSRKT